MQSKLRLLKKFLMLAESSSVPTFQFSVCYNGKDKLGDTISVHHVSSGSHNVTLKNKFEVFKNSSTVPVFHYDGQFEEMDSKK